MTVHYVLAGVVVQPDLRLFHLRVSPTIFTNANISQLHFTFVAVCEEIEKKNMLKVLLPVNVVANVIDVYLVAYI